MHNLSGRATMSLLPPRDGKHCPLTTFAQNLTLHTLIVRQKMMRIKKRRSFHLIRRTFPAKDTRKYKNVKHDICIIFSRSNNRKQQHNDEERISFSSGFHFSAGRKLKWIDSAVRATLTAGRTVDGSELNERWTTIEQEIFFLPLHFSQLGYSCENASGGAQREIQLCDARREWGRIRTFRRERNIQSTLWTENAALQSKIRFIAVYLSSPFVPL